MSAKPAKHARKTGAGMAPDFLPYPPSWVNRLIEWIKRLPIPSWLFYLGVLLLWIISLVCALWLDGYPPFSQNDIPLVYRLVGLYPVVMLAAIHYFDNAARRCFDDFRPALGKGDAEAARLRYELTTLPPRQTWVAFTVGAIFGLVLLFLADYSLLISSLPVTYYTLVGTAVPGFATTMVLLYHTIRQLRLVSHIHSVATGIDLFDFAPLYSFSRLSAQTGLFFILILYFDLTVNILTMDNPGLFIFNFAGLPLFAAACFILPIEGMHRRLVREKQRLLWDVNRRLEVGMDLLYRRVDQADLGDADAVNKTLNSLITSREIIMKAPTWPWQPETSTLFISALTLPVIVFLIQMLLTEMFGF